MNLMGVIGLQIKGFTIQNFEAVAFTQVTFNIKRLDVETCLANIFHLQKKSKQLELILENIEFLNFVYFENNNSLTSKHILFFSGEKYWPNKFLRQVI